MQPRYIAASLLVLLLAFAGVAWAVRADGSDVDIQQAYFVAASPAGADLNLTASLFVTNEGARASEKVSVVVFLLPQSGLSTFTTRVDVGPIAAHSTRQAAIPVVIPGFNASQSYRVDFLVFQDDLLTHLGSGRIGWGAGSFYDYDLSDKAAISEGLSVSAPSFSRVG